MKRGSKKWIILTGVLMIVILLGASAVDVFKNWNHKLVYYLNWDVEIPKKLELQYHKDTGSSFHGDGTIYDVYECTDDETDVIREMDELKWGEQELVPKYQNTYPEFIEECLKTLGVPEEEYPDYENCIYAYMRQTDASEIVFAYDTEEDKLYVGCSMM